MFNLKFFEKNLKVLKQQQFNNLERYVNLECDLTIKGNVLPAVNMIDKCFEKEKHSIYELFKIQTKRQCKKDIVEDIKLNKLALIKTKAKISFKNQKKWRKDKEFKEFSKYKDNFLKGDTFAPIILIHPQVLTKYSGKSMRHYLYQLDGMHRVMSALEAGLDELEAYVIVNRDDLHIFISEEDKQVVSDLGGKCTWFPRYQEIREIGLKGQRVQEPRYTEIYDFSALKDKVVVDFGGNIGQAAIEAYFNGAKKVYNLDYQKDAIETGKKIVDILGLDITYSTIDFNAENFEEDVFSIVKEWDWTVFQAIYRTFEIKDVDKNLQFIVKNTKKGLVFEGKADSKIDTDEFYQNIFKPYKFKKIDFLGRSQNRPAYMIEK